MGYSIPKFDSVVWLGLVYSFNGISTPYGLFIAEILLIYLVSFGLVWFRFVYLSNSISTPYG